MKASGSAAVEFEFGSDVRCLEVRVRVRVRVIVPDVEV